MGAGWEAGEQSREAVRLLERFLRAGIDPAVALSTLNSALILRGDAQTEGFVTIDLCICNLLTGQTRFLKNGASPSYIKRGHKVSHISGQGWPVGLGVNASSGSDVTTLRLDAGDLAVMMSDGVCEMGEDPWLTRLLEGYDGTSTRELAGNILEQAILQNGQGDDMMVLVLSLDERIGT
jgi:stage II sporulation protein E